MTLQYLITVWSVNEAKTLAPNDQHFVKWTNVVNQRWVHIFVQKLEIISNYIGLRIIDKWLWVEKNELHSLPTEESIDEKLSQKAHQFSRWQIMIHDGYILVMFASQPLNCLSFCWFVFSNKTGHYFDLSFWWTLINWLRRYPGASCYWRSNLSSKWIYDTHIIKAQHSCVCRAMCRSLPITELFAFTSNELFV